MPKLRNLALETEAGIVLPMAAPWPQKHVNYTVLNDPGAPEQVNYMVLNSPLAEKHVKMQ